MPFEFILPDIGEGVVEAEVRKAIADAGEGGGFMLGPGCTVYQDMPRANYNAVGRAVSRYGWYRR